MRSWLSSPTVAFLSFLATVLTLGQFAVLACKLVSRWVDAERKSRRPYKAVVVVGLGALAVVAPLTWSAILTAAHNAGNEGIIGALYPPMVLGSALSGLLTLSIWNSEGESGRPWPQAFLILLGFGGVAFIYSFSGAAVWELALVNVFPALVISMLSIAMMFHGVSHSKARAAA